VPCKALRQRGSHQQHVEPGATNTVDSRSTTVSSVPALSATAAAII
jgi:hypothetical protein